jgi:hypothetical protein
MDIVEKLMAAKDFHTHYEEAAKEIISLRQQLTKPADDTITLSITEYEQLLADKKRLDWLESSKEHHGFCHVRYGEYRYYAHQTKDYPSVREAIDQAISEDKHNG